jgi:hypothetical protein
MVEGAGLRARGSPTTKLLDGVILLVGPVPLDRPRAPRPVSAELVAGNTWP